MKKKALKSIVLAVVMILALSVSACGSKEAGDITLEDYFKDPEIKAALEEEMVAVMAEKEVSVGYEVKGNNFKVIYQYLSDYVLPDDAADQLEAALESNAAVFEAEAHGFDAAIGQEGACTVSVQYLDAEGNLIAEKSYKAQ